MEILLLVVAGIVLYMLYNSFSDYMKNPYKLPSEDFGDSFKREYKPEDNPYIELTDEDRIKKGEFGILAQILAHIAQSDGKVCDLEHELISEMLNDMAVELNQYNDYKDARGSLQSIFDEATKESDLDNLANAFVEATKGEYKKRVKVVEFLLAVAYADGELSEAEREKIIDVAAIFELNNDDFNRIYDEFEAKFAQSVVVSKERAMELLRLNENFSRVDLENAYQSAIKAKKQNIFKSLNKPFDSESLREVDSAYKVLSESMSDSNKSSKSSAEDSGDSSESGAQDSTPKNA